MANITFSTQETYREKGTEPRKKLKKVRSVKVANLDRLRLSMRREKTRVNRSVVSESSSTAISGTSSPNYMKATTSSARKGSLQANSVSSCDSRTSSVKSTLKLNKLVSVQECSDSGGVDISVKVKSEKCIKRVPSLKHSKKLSSRKSMKIRARYSQFPDVGINHHEMLEFQDNADIIGGGIDIDSEIPNVSGSDFQDSMVPSRAKQKGNLERSRSRKLMRYKSIRSSRTKQRPHSRLSGREIELMSSDAEPYDMKGSSSQETRKNSAKGLTRTSSLRPLRILAKIPSLRPKRSKVRKRPQVTPLSRTGVARATCSSALKRTAFPDHDIQLHSRGGELEGTSSFHVCPYSYCSIHGRRNQAPSQPLKEFISVKRKLLGNQKREQLESHFKDEMEHYASATGMDQSTQIVSAESYASGEVENETTENAAEAEDDGIDFLVKIYAKPRRKWAAEGALSNDAEALNGSTYDQVSVGDYEGKLSETLSETSGPEEKSTLNDGEQEIYETSRGCNVDLDDKTQQQNSNIAAISLPLELPDMNGPESGSIHKSLQPSIAEEELQNLSGDHLHFASRDSAVSLGDNLINYLSDKQKYTSMWQLIHQQLISSEASMNEAQGVKRADEKEVADGNANHEMDNLDVKQSKHNNNFNEEGDDQVAAIEKLELNQSAAVKLVQEALNAILQLDADQQSNPVQEMANSSVDEHILTPPTSKEETFSEGGDIGGQEMKLELTENQNRMKQIGNRLLQKDEPNGREMSGRQMSKSLSKLRKMFVTAKFIKAMERLKKINPRKPQYLSPEKASENERVHLRHLSMNERKNTEEWMLDNALRQVISKLDPDQQRRVAQLVEAFETVTPEMEEKSNRNYLVKSVSTPMYGETKQFVEFEQDVLSSNEQVVPVEKCAKEDNEYQASTTDDKILQESDETNSSESTLVLPEKSSKAACVNNISFGDKGMGDKKPRNTLKVPSQSSNRDSEVSLVGDMTSIFFNKQRYTGMWNLIYQQVASNEASINEQQRADGFNEEEDGCDTNNCQETNDMASTPDIYSMDQREDNDIQSAASEKPELDQSAAIKLVKDALSAILMRYEQPTHLQSSQDHHRRTDNTRDYYISAPLSCTEDNSTKSEEKHTYSDPEDKLHYVEDTSLPVQGQVECDELKAPQRKMSKSLSKLKKAIATTRFIKAMERLTKKSSLHKSQNQCSDSTSEAERVYLRHRSMVGRKNDEEWMLDYALRQVISKMAPEHQRRVALLAEAFETLHPDQKEKSIKCYPLKGEAADRIGLATPPNEANKCYLESQQQRSISIEQVLQKKDDGIQLPTRDTSLERYPGEHHDQQASSADSTLELFDNDSRLASVAVKLEEPSTENEETGRSTEFSSSLSTGNSEVDSDIATILTDKQKYKNMWHLIYQHVNPNEASTAGKQEVHGVNGEEQGDEADTCQAINDPESTTLTPQLKKSDEGEDNQNADFDQSAAIYLVKEAINAILQSHEQKSEQKSLQDHCGAADDAREFCYSTALASRQEISGEKRVDKHSISEPKEKLHSVESTSGPLQQQAEQIEAIEAPKEMSKSFRKLKKAIATAKFIKAMERLRKISPRKVRHLSAEMATEKERVYLRHLSINERKNEEEWMLDYALRKVIANLAPDQQKKVALLVEAFEIVKPARKGIENQTKLEWDPAIESEISTDNKELLESKLDGPTSPMLNDRLNMLGKGSTSGKSVQKDHSIKFLDLRTDLSHKILDSDDSNCHNHQRTSIKGSPVSDPFSRSIVGKEEIDAHSVHETFQHTKDPEQDDEANITEGIFCDKQKNTSMWHLIYQHVESVSVAEAGSKVSEELTSEDQKNKGSASSEIISDAETDDSDASSITSELTESDAIKLVREAINDILNAPQDLQNESTSNNRTAASEEGQSVSIEEKPKKNLSRGFSKLRKFIICKKFIKAMEKTRKSYPQKQFGLPSNSDSETGKAHLMTRAMGEKKGMDEWMLDNVLQKVISELAPVQQRRVSLLVKAFEKVNPNVEERGKELYCPETKFSDTISTEGETKKKEDALSSQDSELPGGFDLKLDKLTTSSNEVVTERVPQEVCKKGSPSLTKEYAPNGGTWRSGGPCSNIAATSDAITTLPDNCKDPTEINGANAPAVSLEERTDFREEPCIQLKKKTLIGEHLIEVTEIASKSAKKSPQSENLEDEWNNHLQTSRSLEKSISLWGLILQHVATDMLDENEAPKTSEIDVHAQGDSTKMSERKIDDSSQLSSRGKSCRDMGVQTPTSFEFQENEAIKLVETAVEEMLLFQDQISDTESMTSSTTSEQEVYSPNNGEEPSSAAAQSAGFATSLHIDTVATPDEDITSSKEKLPNNYSTLSKVILCKRFVKAMKKMRKLKPVHEQDLSQTSHSAEGIPSLRQVSPNDKQSWEEAMLDNALQKVIGNLAPAKKQRVSLLVQAFETVGSHPAPSSRWKGRA
ncbi:calmodulin binding protein PICBP isoform X2 [Beta vulgaris subsp. vulgaris]|uniref:calmodulin binding protein PICBP isoform X2 n=1 Tax=Beta vulgaris subsp. vulgaris TaxID=3555 RepID=UPI002036E67D|nr:calmodulin binding protein PICBP isoform X2 [Beta vulgaris subsp. vulgaris]